MSLEERISELTAAVKEQTALLKGIGAAAKAGTTTAAAGTKPATAPKKKTGPTQEDVAARFGAYLAVTDKAERKERIAMMGKLNAHFEVAKITEADPTVWPDALAMLDKMEAGEDPFEDEGGGEGESLV